MQDFFKLVERMRTAQRLYERNYDTFYFGLKKTLENEVDAYIRNINIEELIQKVNGK